MHDNDILELYMARDESAIEETSLKYGNYCKKVAMNILGQQEDSDECVNDAYLAAWNSIPPQRPSLLGGFLAKITRNLALDRYRARNAQKRSGNLAEVLSELEECLPSRESGSNIQTEYEEGETARLINAFLEKQKPIARQIFIRRYFNGDSLTDIAACHRISYSKTASILHRLRQKLKNELEKEGVHI